MTPTLQQRLTELYKLVLPELSSTNADRLLLAIGHQESGWNTRKQYGGPALSFWQVEPIGVEGLEHSRRTEKHLKTVQRALLLPSDTKSFHICLLHSDIAASAVARLLLFAHPYPIPTTEELCWMYYLSTWRPGKPSRERWTRSWSIAAECYPTTYGTANPNT